MSNVVIRVKGQSDMKNRGKGKEKINKNGNYAFWY